MAGEKRYPAVDRCAKSLPVWINWDISGITGWDNWHIAGYPVFICSPHGQCYNGTIGAKIMQYDAVRTWDKIGKVIWAGNCASEVGLRDGSSSVCVIRDDC
jgi:hypothetical protein